jgi:ABC-2 type transport system ATP-binding protein
VSAPALELTGVGKCFTKYDDVPLLLSVAKRLRARNRRSELWAIRGVDATIDAGERVGVIGRNGSGKSTLLSLLAGVTSPTEGRVVVHGSVAPLISVGVGFHPELTGRENVFVNGTILGLSRAQVEHRLDDVIDLADIGDFLDTPIKFYSSGMTVRLGFAVAVQAEPDILLVDEVLAVGDLSFQVRSFDRMREIAARGTTVVVVSHNLNAVAKLCPRTLVVDRGALRFDGPTGDALAYYHDLLNEPRDLDAPDDEPALQGGVAAVRGLSLLGPDGGQTSRVVTGADATFVLDVAFQEAVEAPVFGFSLVTESGAFVYGDSTALEPAAPAVAGERRRCEIRVPLSLPTGSYIARASVNSDLGSVVLDQSAPLVFYVEGRDSVTGAADLRAHFAVGPSV